MEQYINDFMDFLTEVKHASINTLQAYRNDLKRLQLFLEKQGIDSADKINETILNSYILSMEKEGFSPASVSRNIASMKAFLLYLIKHGIITGDPSERIKPPKVQKKLPQVIETDIVDLLLQQPDRNTKKGIRDRAILELLYATGIRVSELISVKISDINLSGFFLSCGDRRERIVPFGKAAADALQKYLKIRSGSYDKHNTDILFLNSSGESLTRQGLWKILKSYANKAGLDGINPNNIRHSFAAHLLNHGADLGSVQELLGHADISTTQLYFSNTCRNTREVYKKTHPRA